MALPSVETIPLTDECVAVSLKASSAVTATGESNLIVGLDRFSGIVLHLDVTDVSGTSATLNVFVQAELPDQASYTDFIAFSSVTATGGRVASYISGGNQEFAVSDGTLAQGSFKSILLPPRVKVKWVVAGTSPSFTFSLSAFCYR